MRIIWCKTLVTGTKPRMVVWGADTNSDYWPLIQRRERVLNAGVDVNDYRPVTFEEMVENNRKFKAAHAGQDCAHNADETAKN